MKTQKIKIKQSLLATLLLLAGFQTLIVMPAEADAPAKRANYTSRKLSKKEVRKARRFKKKKQRVLKFVNSKLGKWMIKKAVKKALRRPKRKLSKREKHPYEVLFDILLVAWYITMVGIFINLLFTGDIGLLALLLVMIALTIVGYKVN
ncbi:MAG TPA: hypothetical protein DCS93_04135 [Microscillaceae bacterium]|nr:hypothetical protein [Microscillaceae bacterium]